MPKSVEVVQADNPSMGVQPWAVWRQSGHKGRHWLSTTVLVPPMEDMERYKVSGRVGGVCGHGGMYEVCGYGCIWGMWAWSYVWGMGVLRVFMRYVGYGCMRYVGMDV